MAVESRLFNNPIQQKIQAAIRHAEPSGYVESYGITPWKPHSLEKINMRFETVIAPFSSIVDVCANQIANGTEPVGLKLMGYEFIFDEIRRGIKMPFHGMAVSLGRNKPLRKYEESKTICIPGNILHPDTWIAIENGLRMQLGYDSFGFIFWNPGGGLQKEFITDEVSVYSWLQQNAFNLLSRRNGMLLCEIPKHFLENDAIIKSWITATAEEFPNNIFYDLRMRTALFIRNNTMPELPELS